MSTYATNVVLRYKWIVASSASEKQLGTKTLRDGGAWWCRDLGPGLEWAVARVGVGPQRLFISPRVGISSWIPKRTPQRSHVGQDDKRVTRLSELRPEYIGGLQHTWD